MAVAATYQPNPCDIQDVAGRLDEKYGRKRWHAHHSPLDELVATILSQHTSDSNTANAFASLKSRFGDWDAVRTAPTAEVEAAIRTGGLAAVKAPRIQNILNQIDDELEALDLEFLRTMPMDDAREWLLALHGVGPKTAACVLLFSLGKPALPVDTHVHRVSLRLGLIGTNVTAEAAHVKLESLLSDKRDVVYSFHLNAIAHGRSVCKARNPRCNQCLLQERCSYVHQREHDD